MINFIWLLMLVGGVLTAALKGDISQATSGAVSGAQSAVEVAIGLIGVLSLWSGIMKIAEEAGIVRLLARLIHPLFRRLFPGIPSGHEAMGAIIMAISANILGLGNAATPLGLKAMRRMQELNPDPETATDAMCTFLAVTTCGLTIIPTTVIAIRASLGSADPTVIVGPTIAATATATTVALIIDRLLRAKGGP